MYYYQYFLLHMKYGHRRDVTNEGICLPIHSLFRVLNFVAGTQNIYFWSYPRNWILVKV